MRSSETIRAAKRVDALVADAKRLLSFLLKPFRKVCKEFDLIAPGDRVAVGASGGKGSRWLLELLLRHRRRATIDCDILTPHIVGTPVGLPNLRSTPEPWFRSVGVQHHRR